MKTRMTLRLLPALMLTAFSGSSAAAGFQLLEQNASGIGNAYAGSAAVAENASTIFFNPAGMTKLQDTEASLGVSVVRTSYEFTNNGSSVGALAATGNGGDAGGTGYVPNAYVSHKVGRDLYLGVGIGAPWGLATEYDSPWVGGAQSIKFDIKTVNLNPSIAYRLSDTVSLGAGLDYQKFEAEYQRLTTVAVPPAIGGQITLNADDTALGWNVGGLVTLSPTTRLGFAYRSKIKYKLEGSIVGTGLGAAASGPASAEVELPDTWYLSVTHKLSDRWELLGDVTRTGWSSIQSVDFKNGSGTTLQSLDTQFENSWRVAFGATYTLDAAWKLKYGIAYDQTPIKDAAHRLTSLPDNDRLWLSIGAQFKPTKTSALDAGFAYLRVKDSQIDNNQTADGRGRVTGSYEANGMILGLQYSTAF